MNKGRVMKIVNIVLAVFTVGAFVFLAFGEVLMTKENELRHSQCSLFEPQWVQVLADGTAKEVELPGRCEAEYGEWVVIEAKLGNVGKSTAVCMRSMQQEVKVYVDGEIRTEYSTLDIQPFGKTSTMTYVFIPISEEDADRTIRIEFMSESSYAGYVSEMYIGVRGEIVQYLCDMYAPSAIMAVLLLIFGIVIVVVSIVAYFFYGKMSELGYLGIGIVITAAWLLVESRIRQFILPNSTIAMLTGFLLIAIMPYPFLAYINKIQKRRYETGYMIIGIATAINFVAVVMLQVLGIRDFFESMGSSHVIIGVLIVETLITVVWDGIRGNIREYREVLLGYAAFMLAGIVEILMVYNNSARYNGIPLCVGLALLVFMSGLKAVRDLFQVEKDKQYALAMSESKAKFLANMSHEIRTPINTIVGMNEMILRENKSEEIDEYANNIKGASTMLLGIINDILDFSKIEAGKFQIVDNDYSLADMLKDVVIGFEMRAKNKGLEFNLNVDEQLPSVLKGDEVRIRQVLNNILSNAVKYTEKGSITFTVSGVKEEGLLRIIFELADTGIGIKKEDLETIFVSFKRLELEKNRYIEGTGLGLNITKMLVDLMNGSIDVKSEYGKGSCFTVTLTQPIVDGTPIGNLSRKRKTVEKKEEQTLDIPDAKILVVDDTKINLKVMAALLKRTNAMLDLAEGGAQSVEMTKNKKYDLILMDHMMPEPDGIQALHMIKDDSTNPNIDTPIVVLTANAIAGAQEEYLQEGFDGYLSKPVKPEELEVLLREILLG